MNKDKDQIDHESDDTVAKLMSLAGPRADIEADRQSRVHDKVRQEWLRSTRKKNRALWLAPVALAASVLLVVALNIKAPETPLPQIGTISYVATNAAQNPGSFSIGDAISAGDVIDTGDVSGLSVSLPGDISLRVAASTTIRFDQADEFTLLNGQVYADTGDQIYRDRHITIHTAIGSATDIGTQFSVSYVNDRLDIAVREGRVDVAKDRDTYTAAAGDKLSVDTGANVVREKVTAYDASWQWASSLAPEFDIENKSLLEFLKWASRETGKELTFSSDELRMGAMGTKLFGSVRGFAPADAIESVLSTTRFRYRIDEQSIMILE